MRYLVDRNMMKEIDACTIQDIGIPSLVLMERAALKVYEYMISIATKEDRILAICGYGNNGGDGIVVARLLKESGYQVDIFFVGDEKNITKETQQQVIIAQHLQVSFVSTLVINEYNIIIDAIFGVGLSRPVIGECKNVIDEINQSQKKIISVDVPSGICVDNGSVMNVAVRADATITFGFDKIGFHVYPGNEYVGELIVAPIGCPESIYHELLLMHPEWMKTIVYDKEDMRRYPNRPNHSNKGTFGTVLVVAGSSGMCGAAYFAAKAALRMGAGLVKIMTVTENRVPLQTMLPEAVLVTYDPESFSEPMKLHELVETIEAADTLVVGPGLGQSEQSRQVFHVVLKYAKAPIILDADAINILANELDERTKDSLNLEERISCLMEILPKEVILTPHMKEFSRLIHESIPKIIMNFIDTMQKCSYNNNLTYVIKDSITNVVQKNVRYINTSGNHGLATGGAGDVLAGMIAGLVVQKVPNYEAACFGVYLHGLCAQQYAKDHGTYSLIASDIIDHIATLY